MCKTSTIVYETIFKCKMSNVCYCYAMTNIICSHGTSANQQQTKTFYVMHSWDTHQLVIQNVTSIHDTNTRRMPF